MKKSRFSEEQIASALRKVEAGTPTGLAVPIPAEADRPDHWPAGGCHSSPLFPSGSMTQANFPYSESSIFSRTLQPSSRKTLTSA